MVLPPEKMPQNIADKAAAEQIKRMISEGKSHEQVHRMIMRQWAVEKAVQVCGQDGVTWYGTSIQKRDDEKHEVADSTWETTRPQMTSAVVPIAKEIFAFVMGENDDGSRIQD